MQSLWTDILTVSATVLLPLYAEVNLHHSNARGLSALVRAHIESSCAQQAWGASLLHSCSQVRLHAANFEFPQATLVAHMWS